MKNLICLFTLLTATVVSAAAQDTSKLSPDLTAAKTEWAVIRLWFENANGIITGGRGGGGGYGGSGHDPSRPAHVDRAMADAAARFGGQPSNSHLANEKRGWRVASVELTNTGAKDIKRVHFYFVLTDPQTGAEVLRLAERSPKRLRAGQTRLFSKEVKASHITRRGDGARVSVEIEEVIYRDGTVWRPRS